MLGKIYASIFHLHKFRNFETRLKRGRFFCFHLIRYFKIDLNYFTQIYKFFKFFCEVKSNEENKSQTPYGGCFHSNAIIQNNPVPNRIAPRQLPGVYIVLCLINNKRYYGMSSNVSARLSQHKSRLRRNIHEVPDLQCDFNNYGEENFLFSAVSQNINLSFDECKEIETKLIQDFFEFCYNKHSKISHKKENNPFWGRQHTNQTIQQISQSLRENHQNSIVEGFAIILKGKTYPSISEASRQTGHSRDTIRRWLTDLNNTDCVPQSKIENFVALSNHKSGNQNVGDYFISNSGKSKCVSIYSQIYESISEAAKQRNCSRANIQRLLRSFPENCFVIEEAKSQSKIED
jgi:response regulator of citrate/malate metabolism